MNQLYLCENCGWEGRYVELIRDEYYIPRYCPRCGDDRIKTRSDARAIQYEPKKMANCEGCEWD